MSGIFAHGAEIHMGDGATPTEVFTKIPTPGDFKFKPPERGKVDTTNHDSAGDEHIAGLKGSGEISFDVLFNAGEAMHIALRDTSEDVTDPTNFQLHFPDTESTIASFAATVRVEYNLGVKDAQKMSVTLDISGDITWS
ncbi:MAG: hypothetical protein GY906_11625 [bacterium]|nr:hypothetical protein [bacterium]